MDRRQEHPGKLIAAVIATLCLFAQLAVGEDAPAEKRGAEVQAQLIKMIWWNDEKIAKELKLPDGLRAKMDKILSDHLDARRVLMQKQIADRQAIQEALKNRKWEAARGTMPQLRDSAANLAAQEVQLKIDVLSLLDEEQHEALRKTHGNLFKGPWVRGGGGEGPGGKRRGPKAGMKKP